MLNHESVSTHNSAKLLDRNKKLVISEEKKCEKDLPVEDELSLGIQKRYVSNSAK